MKKFTKAIAILLSLAMIFAFAGCSVETAQEGQDDVQATQAQENLYANIKIGFIFLHDPTASTYDNNFYQAALNVKEKLGLSDDQMMFKWGIPEEGSDCYDTAAEFIDAGCNIIFADSFGHESNMLLAAKEYPEVEFLHATGTQALVAGVSNFHNAFASIYDGRFLAGIAAGMKLNEMITNGEITAEQAKIGYVGAHPYAEVKSGYTSFFLGARYVCPSATMEVVFTNSWFDIALEKEGANKLIDDGCVLISQHADSEGAPKACEQAGVPNIAYNISTIDLGPTTSIISSKINWEPYFEMAITNAANGEEIPANWCGTLETGSVELTELNEAAAAAGTADAIEEARAKLISGELHVFDTSTFTVDGKTLDSYLADVEDMGDYIGETEAVADGYFHESEFRSAPYFDVDIDGITLK